MGIYISSLNCKELYNIDINCQILANGNETYPNSTIVGGLLRGQIPPDPDIAGIGVVASFCVTTVLAIFFSLLTLACLITNRRYLHRLERLTENLRLAQRLGKFHISELCEELVIGISDTQVFTGAAYAIALRYFKGCTTTAYHYDVVVMMMLLTCATHMLSVTIVRNYWRYGFLSMVRLVTCTGVFIVTGILLANQNQNFEDQNLSFPAQIPPGDTNYSMILLPAACFQIGNSQLLNTLHESVTDKSADAFLRSAPGNSVPGWNCYLTTLLFYILAGFVDLLRALRRGAQSKPQGKRARFVAWLNLSTVAQRQTRQQREPKRRNRRGSNLKPPKQQQQTGTGTTATIRSRFSPGNILFWLFCAYIFAGIGVASWTVWTAGHQIGGLRQWMRAKGWLIHDDRTNQSTEDDWTSFGQLVPIFVNLMLIFILIHILDRLFNKGKKDRKYDIYGGIIHDEQPFTDQPSQASNGVTATELLHNKPDATAAAASHGYHHSDPAPGSPQPINHNSSTGHWNTTGGGGTFTPVQQQPGTPGPGILTTTPTTAQIHQFPPTSNTSPSPRQNNRRQSSASSVPTSPLAGAGPYSPYHQQQQQRSMSMTSSPPPQVYTTQGQGQPYFYNQQQQQQQQPQYGTTPAYHNGDHGTSPPPAQGQVQQGGPVYYQVIG